jgi:hypothetical protein
MLDRLLSYGLQYGVDFFEVILLFVLIKRGHAKRLIEVCLYVVFFLFVDGLARPYLAFRCGALEFYYIYWLSDVALVLATFLLICSFFRRAFLKANHMWPQVRRMLLAVFMLVVAISCISLFRHFKHLFSQFMPDFQQNLYFACLVLNTLLYIWMQKVDAADQELGLLVCGIGIQFAGPAASLALVHLTHGARISNLLFVHVAQICTLGMLVTWLYGVGKAPKLATEGALAQKLAAKSALAQVASG